MAERPVECGHCKRPIKVIYKEIVGGGTTATEMCVECPILQKKLHGEAVVEIKGEKVKKETGLCCGSCRTSLEAIQTGDLLGCPECYAVFSDLLFSELASANALPLQTRKKAEKKKGAPLHVGKTPTTPVAFPRSSQLTELNEALNDALRKENYEQAAWIRDQIKALLGKMNHGKETSPPENPS